MRIDNRHLLKRVWLFEQLDDSDLDLILPLAREYVCPAHSILVHQGDTSGDMFAVLQGRLKVATISNGVEVLLSIVGPGDVLGEIALLDGGSRSATVSAFETCRLLVLPRSLFRALLFSVPSLAVRLLEIMAARVRGLTRRAEEAVILDVPTRLARAIVTLAARFGVPAGNGRIRITIKLSQMELGNLIGATREMVNRCLGRFSRRRLLQHRRGILLIVNEAQLRALAEPLPSPAPMSSRKLGGPKHRDRTPGAIVTRKKQQVLTNG